MIEHSTYWKTTMSKPLRKDNDGKLQAGAELKMPAYRYQKDKGSSESLSGRRSDSEKHPNRELLCNFAV